MAYTQCQFIQLYRKKEDCGKCIKLEKNKMIEVAQVLEEKKT